MSDVTRILNAIEYGDPKAADELLPLVYEQLRQLAAHRLAQEAPGQTLQPTALVHEAWMRLIGNQNVQLNGRAHFFAAAYAETRQFDKAVAVEQEAIGLAKTEPEKKDYASHLKLYQSNTPYRDQGNP